MATTPTKEQTDIIEATEGYVRCGAVPGSGKTFCLTNRMAYLINNLYIDPASIVALTFTNKAARNMTNRLKQMIGDKGTCFTGTFHRYCNLILKDEIYRLSWPKTYTIEDKKSQIDIISAIAHDLGLSLKDCPARIYMGYIAKQKTGSLDYVDLLIGSDKSPLQRQVSAATDDLSQVYYRYLLYQRDNFILDFNDVILFAVYILKHYQDALKKWQDKCMYVLCDEYQDVNGHQEQLLKLLSGRFHNLTVVGDDDQCIYGWRDADVEYIVEFDKRYPNVQTLFLSENFRSTPEIIAVANSLITKNQNRISKMMFTNNPSGAKPVYNCTKTANDEGLWIANTIKNVTQQGKLYSNHTVLVRSSTQMRALEEAFVKAKVPYKILGGAKFYDSEEIKTVLAYLRSVYAMKDSDITYTINRPKRGYGKKSLENLKNYAEQRGLSLMEALGEQINNGTEKKASIIDYYNNIKWLNGTYQNYSSKELVNMVLDFGYREALQQDIDQTKIDNVSELFETIAALETDNQENIPLDDLLTHFALYEDVEDNTEKDVVRIMTIHASKGLEFDTVFVPGLVQGQFPNKRSLTPEKLQEERRLLYVAITRAESMLYLSSYDETVIGDISGQSEFLSDIDSSLLDFVGNSTIKVKRGSTPAMSQTKYKVGDMVSHHIFGVGMVVRVDKAGQRYEIKFNKDADIRRLSFEANLMEVCSTGQSSAPW